jgi:hypothetical protein
LEPVSIVTAVDLYNAAIAAPAITRLRLWVLRCSSRLPR